MEKRKLWDDISLRFYDELLLKGHGSTADVTMIIKITTTIIIIIISEPKLLHNLSGILEKHLYNQNFESCANLE